MSVESAFVKFQALATASLDDCYVWEQIYLTAKNSVNGNVELVYGKEEVSQRVADYVTSGGIVSEMIGDANEMAAKLVSDCNYYDDRMVTDVLGGFNQNIIDSVEIYKGTSIKAVPIFGNKLTSYSTLAVQKVNAGLQEAYSGLVNKLGVVAHDAPNYVANKAAGAVSSAGSDDASLILGLTIGGVIGLGAYLGKKMKDSGLFYDGK